MTHTFIAALNKGMQTCLPHCLHAWCFNLLLGYLIRIPPPRRLFSPFLTLFSPSHFVETTQVFSSGDGYGSIEYNKEDVYMIGGCGAYFKMDSCKTITNVVAKCKMQNGGCGKITTTLLSFLLPSPPPWLYKCTCYSSLHHLGFVVLISWLYFCI